MKSLRLKRGWSQEQLAEFSGLNARTIQRAEKGQSIGSESLKSLAAVFEVSADELKVMIAAETESSIVAELDEEQAHAMRLKAQEKVKSIKYFYGLSLFLLAIFCLFFLPNYNGGENLGALIVVFLSFATIVIAHAVTVFQPFSEDWEARKVDQVIARQNKDDR